MSTETLSYRKTRKYVGTYRHLDEWEQIGEIDVLSRTEVDPSEKDLADPCEPTDEIMTVRVYCDSPKTTDETIEKAIRDKFSVGGCAHTYDCCGCTSTYTKDMQKLSRGHYRFTLHSYRNY